ncbi:MAG: hypothetical protein Tsb002_10730 [Wenzhouxiangellaceae bacterium]
MLTLLHSTAIASQARITRADDDLLIMTLAVDGQPVHDGLLAYRATEATLLPLSEVIAALNLALEVDVAAGTVKGWYRQPDQTLLLDVSRRQLFIAGQAVMSRWDLIEWHDFEIYVDSAVLGEWLGLEFIVELSTLSIKVPAVEWLPVAQRQQRQRRWQRLSDHDLNSPDDDSQPPDSLPYSWLSWPASDHHLTIGRARNGQLNTNTFRYDLLAAGDSLRFATRYSINLARQLDGRTEFSGRLRLDRVMGQESPLYLRLGDFTAPAMTLIGQQRDGAGLMIGNVSVDESGLRSADLSQTGLAGDALNGWDVELYRNNELLAFQTVDDSNRYQFDSVPLQFGLNLFRLVFYGPQGQRREVQQQLAIGDSMLPPGEQQWLATIHFSDRRWLPGQPRSLFRELETGLTRMDSLRGSLRYRRGLNRHWSLDTGLASVVDDLGQRRQWLSSALQGAYGSALLDFNFAADSAGGVAAQVQSQWLRPQGQWQLGYAYFDHFNSPLISASDGFGALRHQLQLRWRGLLDSHPLTLESDYQQRQGGRFRWRNQIRYSRRQGPFNVAAALAVLEQSELPGQVSSNWLLSYRQPQWNINAQVNYLLQPQAQLQSANLTAGWRFSPDWNLRWNARMNFADELDDSLSMVLSWRQPSWVISLSGRYQAQDQYQINLSLFTSLYRAARQWRWHHRSTIASSACSARVFLDANGNGRFDDDEQVLTGIALRVNGAVQRERTDDNGLATLSELPVATPLAIQLHEASLSNPFWAPLQSTPQRIALRPGQHHLLQFPVIETAEIDGTVWLNDSGGRAAAANVRVQVLDAQGELVRTVTTAFDGFFLIDRLLPGEYTLRLEPQQMQRLRLHSRQHYQLALKEQGMIRSGMDFEITAANSDG